MANATQDSVTHSGRFTTPSSDRRERPLYSVGEAAELVSIPHRTMRDWALGRNVKDGRGLYSPVLEYVDSSTGRLSFFDLIEAHILRAARERHLPLQRIKRGLRLLKESRPDNPRPLLSYDFMTDGKNLLVKGMLEGDEEEGDGQRLVNASEHGQIELAKLIEEHLQLIVRDDSKMPDTLFPKRGDKLVSINPRIFSGRPVIEGTRIPTAIVAQRSRAGETPEGLAKAYGLERDKIVAAIRFETRAA